MVGNEINRLTEEVSLIRRDIFSGVVNLKIPITFNEMHKSLLALKFSANDLEKVEVFSNNDFSVSLVCKLVEQSSSFKIKDIIDQTRDRLRAIPSIEIMNNEVKQVNGKEVAIIEFNSNASSIYNLIFTTIIEGKIFIGTFNCNDKHISKWKSVGKEILNSIQIGCIE